MRTLLVLLAGLVLSSCDNSIDLYGPEVETPVVWCLLDAADSIHYVRLQRSFQAEGQSGITAAADPDKIYYPEDGVSLLVTESIGAVEGRTWTLQRVIGDTLDQTKETGLFADSPNVLYRFDAGLLADATYNLAISLVNREGEFRAETALVKSFPVYYPGNPATEIDYSDTGRYTIQWVSAAGGQLYDGFFELFFEEFDGSFWQRRQIRYPLFRNKVRLETQGFEVMQAEVQNILFYTGLRSTLPPSLPGTRRFLQLDLLISASGPDVYRLYLNNQASLGISGLFITTVYSNLSNGLGIFSSRRITRVRQLRLTPATLDSLACGAITRNLGFARPPSVPGSADCP